MSNLIKNLFIIMFILLFQLGIYSLFILPTITQWGASKEEVTMPMIGDDKRLSITSTRAILINSSKEMVWQWLMQLGAHKQGFYSYDFIEHGLTDKMIYPTFDKSRIKNFKVGDILHGSTNKKSNLSVYNFQVLSIQPEESFVLENWGTFLLKSINDKQTRLIIRTQEIKSSDLYSSIKNHFILPLHFIMERRMLQGIKVQSEQGEQSRSSYNKDMLWFASLILSWGFIVSLFFIIRGLISRIIMVSFFASLWLGVVLLLDPIPIYSMALLIMVFFLVFNIVNKNKRK